jgi:hypothetical protein
MERIGIRPRVPSPSTCHFRSSGNGLVAGSKSSTRPFSPCLIAFRALATIALSPGGRRHRPSRAGSARLLGISTTTIWPPKISALAVTSRSLMCGRYGKIQVPVRVALLHTASCIHDEARTSCVHARPLGMTENCRRSRNLPQMSTLGAVVAACPRLFVGQADLRRAAFRAIDVHPGRALHGRHSCNLARPRSGRCSEAHMRCQNAARQHC